jgi:LDH2 family malate/lactate/ureidoglycolate dehydrogenase
VRVKHNSAQPAPAGWLVDANGAPTVDAGVLYAEPRGSIMPLGGLTAGHKGYALNIALELLGGALSGSGCAQTQQGMTNGVLLFALDITQLCSPEEFYAESERFFEHVRSSPPQPGVERVLLPGEIEQRTRAARLQAGISVDEGTWQQVVACATERGVAIPAA